MGEGRSSLVRPRMQFNGADVPPVEYLDTVWKDELTPATATRVNPVTSKPDYGTFRGNTKTFLFDGSSDEGVTFDVQFNHDMKLGADVCPHVHWSPMTTGTGTVIWYLEYTWIPIGGDFPATATTAITTYTISSDEQYKHILTALPDIDFSTNDGVSSMLKGYLYRDASTDTYADEAAFHAIDFHIEIDTAGSRTESAK